MEIPAHFTIPKSLHLSGILGFIDKPKTKTSSNFELRRRPTFNDHLNELVEMSVIATCYLELLCCHAVSRGKNLSLSICYEAIICQTRCVIIIL